MIYDQKESTLLGTGANRVAVMRGDEHSKSALTASVKTAVSLPLGMCRGAILHQYMLLTLNFSRK